MRFEIKKLTPEEWKPYSEAAAMISFGEVFDPTKDRIDVALLVVDGETPAGFLTIKEMDADTAYIQHGGVFPKHENTVHVWKQYLRCLQMLYTDYSYVWTRIDNKNTRMLKMALQAGFVVTGIFVKDYATYLELELDPS